MGKAYVEIQSGVAMLNSVRFSTVAIASFQAGTSFTIPGSRKRMWSTDVLNPADKDQDELFQTLQFFVGLDIHRQCVDNIKIELLHQETCALSCDLSLKNQVVDDAVMHGCLKGDNVEQEIIYHSK